VQYISLKYGGVRARARAMGRALARNVRRASMGLIKVNYNNIIIKWDTYLPGN